MLIKRLFWNAPVKKKSSFFFLTTFDAIYAQWIYTSERHVWRQWLDAVYVYTVYTFVVLDWKNIRREKRETMNLRCLCDAVVVWQLLLAHRAALNASHVCTMCVVSSSVCNNKKREKVKKKRGSSTSHPPPPHHHHRHYVQKSTPLACVHHMSCDAGAGAVRERETAFFYLCFSSIFLLLLHSSTTYMKSFVCVVVLSSLLDVYSYIHLHFKTYLSVCCWAVTRCLSLSYTSESLEVTMTFLPKFHGCTE